MKPKTVALGVLILAGLLLVQRQASLARLRSEIATLRERVERQSADSSGDGAGDQAMPQPGESGSAALNRLRMEVERLREELAHTASDRATVVPRDAWRFAGFTMPESTVQSLFWARREGDARVFWNCYTPGGQHQLRLHFNVWSDDETDPRFRRCLQQFENVTNLAIAGVFPVYGNPGRVNVLVNSEPEGTRYFYAMEKVGDEWKITE